MIEDRSAVVPGVRLVAHHRGATYTARVLDSGRIEVGGAAAEELAGVHGSLSAAAKALTGVSTNGWKFWSLADASAPALSVSPTIGAPPAIADADALTSPMQADSIIIAPDALATADAPPPGPVRTATGERPCARALYHSRPVPDAIARTKQKPPRICICRHPERHATAVVEDICYDCLANRLMYWRDFWDWEPLPGHEADVESAERVATAFATVSE